jgi:Protein of unknown function DUF262/Protein of unknown function (DUF1524)
MEEPKSLDSLFKEKIFRIPDYQRGFAWQREQWKAFWEDLINLSGSRAHYTGVLTLKETSARDVLPSAKEFWLLDDHSYRLYHIVDGQQRLTTFVIFLQAFVELVRSLPPHRGRPDASIYVSESLSIDALQNRYLFKVKPTGDQFRTYKFGYTTDNPSYDYLRFRIFGEAGGGSVQETFYTLNLSNAKLYFAGQLRGLYDEEGIDGLQKAYKKLTQRFLFNEYVIKDEFDVFVAFETMNNRGKQLSGLELLKNRLIYLTTLYNDDELDTAERKSLRDTINDAWKEVYHQLGRNKSRPLNDDDFLRAHWTTYYKYSRKTGKDYIRFLLDEQFTPQRIHRGVERDVDLEATEEQRAETDVDDTEEAGVDDTLASDVDAQEETPVAPAAELRPIAVRDYVNSLKESAVHWFNSFYPALADGMSEDERLWIDRLNRVGIGYFRPLIMVILKGERNEAERIRIFQQIERFIFVAFRMTSVRANYRSSEFYNAARALDRKETTLRWISQQLGERLKYTFNDDGTLRKDEFYNILFKKFSSGTGYYGWPGVRYFLYEYELSLLSESRQSKVDWSDLLRADGDKISIEHIYPQSANDTWASAFAGVPPDQRWRYNATLGNLLILSMSINSALQNDSFDAKKKVRFDSVGRKIRNGYEDGSHSEIEVSQSAAWGPDEIRARGRKLLRFMEERWSFRLRNDSDRESLLFLDVAPDSSPFAEPSGVLAPGG